MPHLYFILSYRIKNKTNSMRPNKTIIGILGSCILIIALLAATGYYFCFSKAFSITETTYLYIRPEDSIDSVCRQLDSKAHPNTLKGFRLLSSFYKYDEHIRSGRYAVKADDNAFRLARRLSAGQQSPVNLIIPGVRTMEKLSGSISSRLMLDSATIASALKDSVYCKQQGYTTQTIACLFVPNTYQVYWDMDIDGFFSRMQKEHKRFWNDERTEKAKKTGLTPEQVSTLASIVDEETAKNDEKPIIAGLYINRLKKGMPLQADPTVRFACGDFGLRRILNKHLAVDSPYNTYKHTGLPPGPIRIPSVTGIESVLNYTAHDYLYMCAKEDFSGYHNFARTMSEHLRNAQRYRHELDRRNIK